MGKTTEGGVRAALEAIVMAWEALPGARVYSAGEVQQWLVETMAPAINQARDCLSKSSK